MKKKHLFMAMSAALSASAFAAEVVEINQLPRPVQATLQAQKGPDAIKDIELKTEDGKQVYEVEFTRDGFNPVLWIGADGGIVKDTRKERDPNPEARGRVRSVADADIPAAVRNTIQREARGREVADVDRETWGGRSVYEVEFAQSGRNAQIHIADDGTMVRDERVGQGATGLFLGTQIEDVPAAVQNTIKREAGSREIADIDKETRNGAVVYEVEFKQPGKNVELHIAENGSIVRDSRTYDRNDRNNRSVRVEGSYDNEGVGRPSAEATVGTDQSNKPVIKPSDLPKNVQEQLAARGSMGDIKKLERKTRDGRWVYDVEMEKDGLNRKIEVAEDGTVLRDSGK